MKKPLPHALSSLALAVALATTACEPPVPTLDTIGVGPVLEGVSLSMTAADFLERYPTPVDTAEGTYLVAAGDSLSYRVDFDPVGDRDEPYPPPSSRVVAISRMETGMRREAWVERVAELAGRFGDPTCYALESSQTKESWAEWPTEPGLSLGWEEIVFRTGGKFTTGYRLVETLGKSPRRTGPWYVTVERPECS